MAEYRDGLSSSTEMQDLEMEMEMLDAGSERWATKADTMQEKRNVEKKREYCQ